MTRIVFNRDTFLWLLVLAVAHISAIVGTFMTKTIGRAIDSKLKWETYNESIVACQFAYIAFYTSLLAAFSFEDIYKGACVLAMFAALLFFAAGLFFMKSDQTATETKILPVNGICFIVSLLIAIALVALIHMGKTAVGNAA